MAHTKLFAYNYQIHCVDKAGDVIETIGEMNIWTVAFAAFNAAARSRSWSTIELREGARIVRWAKTGGYNGVDVGVVEEG